MSRDDLLLSDDELEQHEPDELAEYEQILEAELGGLGLDHAWRWKAAPTSSHPRGSGRNSSTAAVAAVGRRGAPLTPSRS